MLFNVPEPHGILFKNRIFFTFHRDHGKTQLAYFGLFSIGQESANTLWRDLKNSYKFLQPKHSVRM